MHRQNWKRGSSVASHAGRHAAPTATVTPLSRHTVHGANHSGQGNAAIVAQRRMLAAVVIVALVLSLLTSLFAVPAMTAYATDYNLGTNSGWIDADQSSLKFDGQDYSSGMTVEYGDDVEFRLTWEVPNSVDIKAGDTFTYALPDGIDFSNLSDTAVYDNYGNQVGTFTVADGTVTVTITSDLGKNVSAYVTVDGTVSSSATGDSNGGNASFTFPGYGTFDVYVTPSYGLQAYKSGAVSTDDNTVYYFVVDVTSTGTNTNVKIQDSAGDLLNLLSDPSIQIYTDPDCTQPYTGGWYVETQDGHSFSLNVNAMADGQTLYVKYFVQVDRAAVTAASTSNDWTQMQRVYNNVTYYSEQSTERKETSNSLWMNSNWSVTKSGSQASADADCLAGGTGCVITWTITIVPPADADPLTFATTVQDALGSNMSADSNATVTIRSQQNQWYDANPLVTTATIADLLAGTVTLPAQADGTAYPAYVLTYSVTADPASLPAAGSGEKVTYANTVTVTPGDGTGTATGTGTVTIGKDAVALAKTYAGSSMEMSQLPWTVTFTAQDDLPAGTVLTDTVGVDSAGNMCGSNQQYFADATVVTVYTDAAMTQPYAGSYSTAVASDQQSVAITFHDAIASDTTLYLQYVTYVNGSVDNGTYFCNTATSRNQTVTAQFQPVGDNMAKSSLYYYNQYNTTGKDTTGLMTWQLWIHDVASNATSIAITDTLPTGLRYVDGSAVGYGRNMVWNGSANAYPAYDGITVTDNGDGTVTFTIAAGSAAFAQAQTADGFNLVYDTAFDYATAPSGTSEYRNSATISVDGQRQEPDSASVWAAPSKLVNKSSTYDGTTAPYITYSVTVNATANTLNGGKALTLTDVLGDGLELRMDSVAFTNKTTGEEIEAASYSYDPSTKTIVFKVPDATPVLISYKALVLLTPGDSFAGLGSNEIRLSGVASDYGQTKTDQQGEAIEAKAGITSDANILQIYKYADGDTTNPLGGATFSVDELSVDPLKDNSTVWRVIGNSTITSTLTSSSTGYTSSVMLAPDTIYRVRETQAPEGYCQVAAELKGADPVGENCTGEDVVIYLVYPNNMAASSYQGITILEEDSTEHELTIATVEDSTGKVTTLQTYLWAVSNTGKVKTGFTLRKVDGTSAPLPGATFTLTKDGDATFDTVMWRSDDCAAGVDAQAASAAAVLVSCTATEATFANLTAGTYTLTETAAPDGYAQAAPITIVITEAGNVIVNGRSVAVDDNGTQTNIVTVPNTPLTTSVTATKVWNDADDQDGARQTITFHLWQCATDGLSVCDKDSEGWTEVAGQAKTIKPNGAESGLTVEWTNLPIKNGSDDIVYKVTETMKEATGFDYTTTWRCTSGEHTVTGGNGVADSAIGMTDGTTPLACTFTNTHTPLTTAVPVTKIWDDDENKDGSRPDHVVVELYADGTATGQTLTLRADENGDWSGQFSDLPAYSAGAPILYTVREVNVPNGYVATVANGTDGTVTVTNTHHPKDDYVWISKVDVGGNLLAGSQLTVTGTTTDGEQIEPISWTSSGSESVQLDLKPGQYTVTETKSPTGYKAADPIAFTVYEQEDGSCGVLINGKPASDNLVTVVDYFETVNAKVSKTSLTNGVGELSGATLTITGTTLAGETIAPVTWVTNGTPHAITLVPGTYRLHESAPPDGYETADDIVFTVTLAGTVEINGVAQGGNTVTMTDAPGTTDVTISKTGIGGGTELVGAEFTLSGVTFEHSAVNVTWTTGVSGSSSSPLCSTDVTPTLCTLEDGTYTLTETAAPDGFRVSGSPISFTIAQGQVIVNGTLRSGNVIAVTNAEQEYTAISAVKRWEDDRDNDGYRSGLTVTAVLYCNGEICRDDDGTQLTETLDSTNNWAYDWTDLPVYDADGTKISYSVNETVIGDGADEYHNRIYKRTSLNGLTFTIYNIHTPDANDLKLTKVWDDADNQDGVRPSAISVIVYGTGICSVGGREETCTDTLITTNLRVTGDGEWHWTLENLPANNAYGNPYTYSVAETPIVEYNGYDENGQCTSAVDSANDSSAGDDAVTLDGDAAADSTGSDDSADDGAGADSSGTAAIADCSPQMTEETDANGTVTAITVTNTHTPATTAVTVTKTWDDLDDHNGTRPDSVTVWLLSSLWPESNGWPVPQSNAVADEDGTWVDESTVTYPSGFSDGDCVDTNVSTVVGVSCIVLNEANNWTYTFTNLPKYADGTLVAYSLTEQFTVTDEFGHTSLDDYEGTVANLTGTIVTDENGDPVTDGNGNVTTVGSDDHYVFALTNKSEPYFNLPTTGGDGLWIGWSVLGALALAAALWMSALLANRKTPCTASMRRRAGGTATGTDSATRPATGSGTDKETLR